MPAPLAGQRVLSLPPLRVLSLQARASCSWLDGAHGCSEGGAGGAARPRGASCSPLGGWNKVPQMRPENKAGAARAQGARASPLSREEEGRSPPPPPPESTGRKEERSKDRHRLCVRGSSCWGNPASWGHLARPPRNRGDPEKEPRWRPREGASDHRQARFPTQPQGSGPPCVSRPASPVTGEPVKHAGLQGPPWGKYRQKPRGAGGGGARVSCRPAAPRQ